MADQVVWYGATKTPYYFELYPAGTAFNAVSGVYVLCRQIPSGSWEALYVGETQSFHQRLNAGIGNHDGYRRAKLAGMTHIAALCVNGETERLRIETDLRHSLDPVANRQNVQPRYST
ncbi:MAG: hypothetical protein AB3N12_01480 [Ruegeria sp.]